MANKRRAANFNFPYLAFLFLGTIATIATIACLGVLSALQIYSKTVHTPVLASFDASHDWGHLSAYADNSDNLFGVQYVGIPAGCRVQQVHVLQRSAQRLPIDYFEEGSNNGRFAQKLTILRSQALNLSFTGSLKFLNDYQYTLQNTGALTRLGAATEFQRGAALWNMYGEDVFDLAATHANTSTRPFVRSTRSNHVTASVPYWIAGFTGDPGDEDPALNIPAAFSAFDYLVIPEAAEQNDTLASYNTCTNANLGPIDELGDMILKKYIPIYLHDALMRLGAQTPSVFRLTTNDLYAMQSICTFETNSLGSSPFCSLFTPTEWAAFSYTFDQMFYYDYSFGNPTGRAQGIGYLQELLARLRSQYINDSNSTVNSTSDDGASDFPLGRKLYVDFTHDSTIVSLLTAMSMDHFKAPPGRGKYPVPAIRKFSIANIVPSGANLITEVIGCEDSNPKPVKEANYWTKVSATTTVPESRLHKLIRMRLNRGILPLGTIRGGACKGRSDGMCVIDNFLESQARAYEMSNFEYACYGDFAEAIDDPTSGQDWDGTIHSADGQT